MNRLRSAYRALPGPLRWALLSGIGFVAVTLVVAAIDLAIGGSPGRYLDSLLYEVFALGALLGVIEWWLARGFTKVTGLPSDWFWFSRRRDREERERQERIDQIRGFSPASERDERRSR